jgi:hypothetical protein
MSETPSQELAKPITESVNDARSRVIVVRKLKSLDRMKVFELIGADNAVNEPYLGYAVLAYAVSSIDGQPQAIARTKLALEAMVQKLDDDGLAAVGEAFKKLYAETPEQIQDAVKN